MVHSRLSSSANTVSASSNVCVRDADMTYLFKTWKDEEKRKNIEDRQISIFAKFLARMQGLLPNS